MPKERIDTAIIAIISCFELKEEEKEKKREKNTKKKYLTEM